MFEGYFIEVLTDYILFACCLFILGGSLFLSFRTRFVQLRLLSMLIPMMRKSLANRKQGSSSTISPHRALFTAMSTTLGIGTIVGPVMAIHWGGPGALIGFLLTAFFGSAATFTEVSLSLKYRKKLETGEVLGGPMQYLQVIFSRKAAVWYALCGSLLMAAWSAAQANQLSAILDSPLLGDYRIPAALSGAVVSLSIFFILLGGIKRVSAFSAKLVPLMFVLYLGSSLWILLVNSDKLMGIFYEIFHSAFSPYAMASGTLVGGVVSALRWGVFKGVQATEAGVGTQTIPHSMAETEDPIAQGMLAMVSTYSAGILAFLSGCVSLVTNTWQDPGLPLGMSMVAASFQAYFSYVGILIVAISTLLFAFGTILGNSYNGSQCFGYLTGNKKMLAYYLGTVTIIFLGTISGVKLVWSVIDLGLACIVLPHMLALIVYAYKQPEELLVFRKRPIAKKEEAIA
jgi:AGCS family alanine or glycine:cation symporter